MTQVEMSSFPLGELRSGRGGFGGLSGGGRELRGRRGLQRAEVMEAMGTRLDPKDVVSEEGNDKALPVKLESTTSM